MRPIRSCRESVLRGSAERVGTHRRARELRTVLREHPDAVVLRRDEQLPRLPGNLSLSLPTSGSTVYKDLLAAGIDLNNYAVGEEPIIDIEAVQRAAGGGAVDPFRGAAPITIANNYKNPRSLQYSVGFDQELAEGLVVGAQFNYVNTVHLQRNRDFNLPLPIVRPDDPAQIPFFGLRGAGAARPARLRPVTSLSSLTVRETSARSMYRGLTFSGRYRKGRVQWSGYYTYAQTFSDDDNERNSTGFNYINSFNLVNEYAPSDLDVRHQLTSNAVITLPLGFELSGILRATSGFPINPVAGSDLNEDFEALSDRGLVGSRSFSRAQFFPQSQCRECGLSRVEELRLR